MTYYQHGSKTKAVRDTLLGGKSKTVREISDETGLDANHVKQALISDASKRLGIERAGKDEYGHILWHWNNWEESKYDEPIMKRKLTAKSWEIIDLLKKSGRPMTFAEIRESTGLPRNYVSPYLRKFIDNKMVEKTLNAEGTSRPAAYVFVSESGTKNREYYNSIVGGKDRVIKLMADGKARTQKEIADETGLPLQYVNESTSTWQRYGILAKDGIVLRNGNPVYKYVCGSGVNLNKSIVVQQSSEAEKSVLESIEYYLKTRIPFYANSEKIVRIANDYISETYVVLYKTTKTIKYSDAVAYKFGIAKVIVHKKGDNIDFIELREYTNNPINYHATLNEFNDAINRLSFSNYSTDEDRRRMKSGELAATDADYVRYRENAVRLKSLKKRKWKFLFRKRK